MTVRAAVFDGPGKPFRFETFPRPTLGPGEALVRIRLCTVCGSDLHTHAGRRDEPTPCVLGHEMVGEVEELGPGPAMTDVDGEPLRIGERVTWSVIVNCGVCFFCTHDLPQKCDRLFKYGKARVEPGRGPFGGLSTHCHLLPNTAVVKLPDELPDAVAAPAMCAAATAAACLRAAGFASRLLVTGAGLLGLTACAMAAAGGAQVAVCDRDDARVALAKRFGATDDWPDMIDAAIELSGGIEPTRFALEQVRTGGTLVLAGAVLPTEPLIIDPERIVRRCLTIRGVHNYAPDDLRTAVRFLAKHHRRYPFAELVGRTFPLEEADEAFRYAAAERPIRVGVVG